MGNFRNDRRGGFGGRSGGFSRRGRDGGQGGFSGGRGNFGGRGRDGGRRSFQETEVTCAQCGKETTVPFKPTGERPVLCSDCFKKGGNSGPKNFASPGRAGEASQDQIDQINKKLDKILEILENIEFEEIEEDEEEN